jgi:polar amino acid transport system substrate-binding protein
MSNEMKKPKCISLSTAWLACLLLIIAATGAMGFTAPRFGPKLLEPQATIKIFAYQYPPLVDSRTPGMGLVADMVQSAFEEENIGVQIEILPIKSLARRTLLYDKGVAMLGEPTLFSASESANLASVATYRMRGAYYYYRPAHREGINWNGDLKKLGGLTYGVLTGEDITPYKKAGIKVVLDDPKQLLRKLKAKEIDFVGMPDLVAEKYIQKLYPDEAGAFVRMGTSARSAPFSLIFNSKHPLTKKLKRAYVKGLEKIRQNGKYDKILSRYQGESKLPMSGTYLPVATASVIEFGSSDTPPYYSPDLQDDGMAGEIVHGIFSEIGIKSRIHYFPLKRLQTDLQNNHLGDPDNFSGQRFSAIVPVALYRSAFFYYKPRHREGILYKKPEDLNGYTIGMIRGTLESRGYFDKNAIRVSEANNEEALFRLLKEGRIDLCGVIRGTGRYTVRKLFPNESENFVAIEIPKSVRPVTIMIDGNHPNGAALGIKINEALRKMVKSGKYLQILEKYYGKGNLPQDWFDDLERFRSRYQSMRSIE